MNKLKIKSIKNKTKLCNYKNIKNKYIKSIFLNKNIKKKFHTSILFFKHNRKKKCLITKNSKILNKKFNISRFTLKKYLKKNELPNLKIF